MIWAIIVKFDQIRKNWWRISCAEILEMGKKFFAASSVKKMSRFEKVSPKKIKRIAWKFTKTVILLGLAGYELIITNSAYGLVSYIYISANIRRVLEEYVLILYITIKQDFVSGLHICREFSRPLECLYQAMQIRKTFSIA